MKHHMFVTSETVLLFCICFV